MTKHKEHKERLPEDDKNNVAFYKKRLNDKTSGESSTEVKKMKKKQAEQLQLADQNIIQTEPK